MFIHSNLNVHYRLHIRGCLKTRELMVLNVDYNDYNVMIKAKFKKRIHCYVFCK